MFDARPQPETRQEAANQETTFPSSTRGQPQPQLFPKKFFDLAKGTPYQKHSGKLAQP